MAPDDLWTIDELSAEVAEALIVDYPGPPSGRVREVPDRRTIRWYTTIGLLDRPAAMRGRTALYGRRHLLQLVAIKRLQADGRSLAAVQEELFGATDTTLSRIARLTAAHAAGRNGGRYAAERVADAPAADSGSDSGSERAPVAGAPNAGESAPAPVAGAPSAPGSASASAIDTAAGPMIIDVAAEPAPAPKRFWAARPAPPSPPPSLRHGIELADSVTLVLPPGARTPNADDLAAIQHAAGRLLAVLRHRGLAPSEGNTDDNAG